MKGIILQISFDVGSKNKRRKYDNNVLLILSTFDLVDRLFKRIQNRKKGQKYFFCSIRFLHST
jgi:hypothetical protein